MEGGVRAEEESPLPTNTKIHPLGEGKVNAVWEASLSQEDKKKKKKKVLIHVQSTVVQTGSEKLPVILQDS